MSSVIHLIVLNIRILGFRLSVREIKSAIERRRELKRRNIGIKRINKSASKNLRAQFYRF